MKRKSRKPFDLSESLHHRLNSYALAASAAGVGVLALVQPAEAKIVYTKTHHFIGFKGFYDLDLNHDGTTDFVLLQTGTVQTEGACWNTLLAKEELGNAVEGRIGQYNRHFASALKRGARIGPGAHFIKDGTKGETMVATWRLDYSSGTTGAWVNVTNRYLGLKFRIAGRTHYGWVRMTVKVNDCSINATLTGYAYETIRNKPIIAGKTKGPDVITVQDASLGHLARGASAISSWRAKENK
jgi:hypothetical protein